MAVDWSNEQNDAIAADYFTMLADPIVGRPYGNAEHNRFPQAVIGRPRGSIEYKHQNISAVLKMRAGADRSRQEARYKGGGSSNAGIGCARSDPVAPALAGETLPIKSTPDTIGGLARAQWPDDREQAKGGDHKTNYNAGAAVHANLRSADNAARYIYS